MVDKKAEAITKFDEDLSKFEDSVTRLKPAKITGPESMINIIERVESNMLKIDADMKLMRDIAQKMTDGLLDMAGLLHK